MVHDAEDGADDEVPLVIETDENEAQTYVDPPHLHGLDAHHGHDVLVPWTAVGTILIDGYHVPRIRRSLGLSEVPAADERHSPNPPIIRYIVLPLSYI